jgi:hypothetical protein
MARWLPQLRHVVASTFVAAVATAVAPAAERPAVHIAPGVRVDGVAVGDLTSEPARRLLRRHFASPLRFAYGAKRWQLDPEHVSYAGVDLAVSDALRARPHTDVTLRVRVRGRAVVRYVGSLARRFHEDPQDAQLAGLSSDLTPIFTDARPGRRVLRDAVIGAIWKELKSGRRDVIHLPSAPVRPKVTAATFGPVIVIQRGANVLRLFEGTSLVRSFNVATGQAAYPTPAGTFSIVDMQRNPWWRPPDSPWAAGAQPIPPGPGNPLGTRWMGTSAPGVGIHGTPDAASIGYSASHGCIRMYVPDAEWLFEHVHVGTPVFIV